MLGLGRHFDISLGVAPVDLGTAGFAGKRFSMQNCGAVGIVIVYGVGTDGDDPVPALEQHTAYTGGTTADLVTMDTIYRKAETALDGDEAWVKTTQTKAAIMTAVADDAQKQKIYYIQVEAAWLTDGYTHISVKHADLSNNAQLVAVLYIPHDLHVQRTPANMPNWLTPGAANV